MQTHTHAHAQWYCVLHCVTNVVVADIVIVVATHRAPLPPYAGQIGICHVSMFTAIVVMVVAVVVVVALSHS